MCSGGGCLSCELGNTDMGVVFSGRDDVLDADGDAPDDGTDVELFVVKLSGANDELCSDDVFDIIDDSGCECIEADRPLLCAANAL